MSEPNKGDTNKREEDSRSLSFDTISRRLDGVDDATNAGLNDDFSAFIAGQMCAVHPTTLDVLLVLVEDGIHGGMTDVKFLVVCRVFEIGRRMEIKCMRLNVLRHSSIADTDDFVVVIHDTSACAVVGVAGPVCSQVRSGHKVLVPGQHGAATDHRR
jgi:hypothetical protein